MAVRVTIRGADQAVARFQQLDRTTGQPLRPLFESVAEVWRSVFQQVIRDQPGGWDPLSATTIRERKREGFGPSPKLIRTGDLLASIQTLRMSEDGFSVGTEHQGAALLHFGGTTSPRSRYPDRPVPPRPFIVLDDVTVSDTMEMVSAYLFEGEPAGA